MSNELQELMKNNPEWYKDLLYRDVKVYIKDNINSASRSFVAIGYYLKYVRDNELFSEDGYQSIWEFAQTEFGFSQSWASRYMSINDRFSKDGNSPILIDKYVGFDKSKLSEMLTLTDQQLEQVTIATTVAEIKDLKRSEKAYATSQQEPECFIRNDLADGVMCSGGISDKCNTCDRFKPEEQEQEPTTIDDLDLSVTTYNCLKRAGIDAIDELCDLTEDDVIKIRNMGRKCLDEINEKLSEVGRELKQKSQRPSCLHEADTECNMINIKPIAESLGMDCNGKCCWGCKELCGARCNASAHRPEATGIVSIEPEENRIPDPGLSCKFDPEARCLIASKESCKRSSDEGCMNCSGGWGEEDYITVEPEHDKPEPVEIIEADIIPTEPVHESMQPELPLLKNNDQRKEFIDAYETWPVWIDIKETGERYYRYNLSDKVAMVVKVSRKHSYQGYKETKDYEYGAEQYYLLGVKTEWHSGKTEVIEDDTRTFYECSTNRSALVDYLKEVQKKGAN